jgi:hypothetical protein
MKVNHAFAETALVHYRTPRETRKAQIANDPVMRMATTEGHTGTAIEATWTGQPRTTRVNWTRARSEKNAPDICA